MPKIPYLASGFPPTSASTLKGANEIAVTWAEIVWAAISVGKAQLQDLSLYGVFSALEMTYRTAIIYANLQQSPNGYVQRSSAYDGLDPSEKSAISYFIGLTMAKLLAGRLLSVPWLMHLDVYRKLLAPVLAGKSRPDLVGIDTSGNWIVVEAKGRTNNFVASVLDAAKLQTQQLTTIQGFVPLLRVASESFFDTAGILSVALSDPPGKRTEVPDLPLTPGLILDSYYRPFQTRLHEATMVGDEKLRGEVFRIAHLPELDMWVGLSQRNRVPGTFKKTKPISQPRGREFLGPDGIFVRLGNSWSDENMKLQPQERARG